MSKTNKLHRMTSAFQKLPASLRRRALSALMGQVVPLVGTAGIRIEEMTPERVELVVTDRRSVRNHIGTVHAAAIALAAETATGFVSGLNVPDSGVVLLKSMHVDYKKRVRGAIRAVATLTAAQREQMQSAPKGAVPVEVHVTDGSGGEPVQCEMVWAWVPKKQ